MVEDRRAGRGEGLRKLHRAWSSRGGSLPTRDRLDKLIRSPGKLIRLLDDLLRLQLARQGCKVARQGYKVAAQAYKVAGKPRFREVADTVLITGACTRIVSTGPMKLPKKYRTL